MDKQEIILRTAEYVKAGMNSGDSGHDWHHVERVRKLAKIIGREEGADLFVVELAALLHDLDDWKFNTSTERTEKFLDDLVDTYTKGKVMHLINDMSFKGAAEEMPVLSKEGLVVQDADRLDALGAIGISRVFSFAGFKKNPIHDPEVMPAKNMTFEEYRKNKSTAINHFYEKLLLIKDRMNTAAGRRIAEGRHAFMEQYLEQFFKEWNGEN
jgi:uncharacterized protein